MPSLRAISTWRNAQDTKAPMAQTVMACHSPPSLIGAKPRPYVRSGGAMLMRQTFQSPTSAAPYRISAVPRSVKKMVVTPKKPT